MSVHIFISHTFLHVSLFTLNSHPPPNVNDPFLPSPNIQSLPKTTQFYITLHSMMPLYFILTCGQHIWNFIVDHAYLPTQVTDH